MLGWDQVELEPHRFGAKASFFGRREIGHVHGDRWVDIPFPSKVHHELVDSGEAEIHPFAPDSGWSRLRLKSEVDLERALELLHRSYQTHQSR